MNFQVPKCVICKDVSDIDFRCINAHLSILQVICHSMQFSHKQLWYIHNLATKIGVSLQTEEFIMLCVFSSSQLSSVCGL